MSVVPILFIAFATVFFGMGIAAMVYAHQTWALYYLRVIGCMVSLILGLAVAALLWQLTGDMHKSAKRYAIQENQS